MSLGANAFPETPLNVTFQRALLGSPDSVKVEATLFDAAIAVTPCGNAKSASIGRTSAANARISPCMIALCYKAIKNDATFFRRAFSGSPGCRRLP